MKISSDKPLVDPGGFIEEFMKHDYDPVKAHEYYLRTRELKGRKTTSKVDPRANRKYNGKPLNKLGTRMEEDETPEVSPTGAKLVDYDGKGLGKATYADGHVYDAKIGWHRVSRESVNNAQASVNSKRKENGLAPLTRRIGQTEQRLIRARTLANQIKDPAKKRAAMLKIRSSENRLKTILDKPTAGKKES